MPPAKQILAFLCASMVLSALIYRDAMWGSSLLAPLDLGPDLFPHYRFMDPEADGIPENHHIADQFTYDLPLQHTIWKSYRNGEIPWWDPHTYGGRPLLADAHINGTDPIRLICYALLPFETAYNWNYILRGILTGLGMFLLLRALGIKPLVSLVLGLSYQFAGWFTLFFGHPWIQGSFVWFPYLWLAWIGVNRKNLALRSALGALLCALVFYAGNLQSHTYLPLFAFTFLVAVFLRDRSNILPAFLTCGISGICGALIAFPVLANQVEFFLLSSRPTVEESGPLSHVLSAPVALAGFYPWAFGSFRTIDAARLVGAGGMAYPLFFGTAGGLLGLLGIFTLRKTTGMAALIFCHALLLLALYLLIISTPMRGIFYSRCAALAGMALTVMAGLSVKALMENTTRNPRRIAAVLSLLVLMMSLGSSALAWFLYPALKPSLEKRFLDPASESQSAYSSYSDVTAMRTAQLERFPSEVSLQNPEAALGLLSALLIGCALVMRLAPAARNRLLFASLCCGLLTAVLFHERFRPKQPVALWQALRNGGPSQHEVIEATRGGLRWNESATPLQQMVFPNAMPSLHGVHAVYGYSALQPPSLLRYPASAPPLPAAWKGDFSPSEPGDVSSIIPVPDTPPSRFRLARDGAPAPVTVLAESQNLLKIDVSQLTGDRSFIRTDTYYPGWKAHGTATLEPHAPCFSKISPENSNTVTLTYSPSLQPYFLPVTSTGLLFTIGLLIVAMAGKRPAPHSPFSTSGRSRAGSALPH